MYGPKIDMVELWPERTCGAQDTLNRVYNTCGLSIRTNGLPAAKYIADYVKKKHILTHIEIKGPL